MLLRFHLCLMFLEWQVLEESPYMTGLELSNPRVVWQDKTSICPCSVHEFKVFFGDIMNHHDFQMSLI